MRLKGMMVTISECLSRVGDNIPVCADFGNLLQAYFCFTQNFVEQKTEKFLKENRLDDTEWH